MNGSIENRGKNTWRLMIELGRDPSGKRLRKSYTVKGTKSEAQKKLRELLSYLDKGVPIDSSKATVHEFLDQWLRDYAQPNTCISTFEGYTWYIKKYIVPYLGSVNLSALTPQHVQGLHAEMIQRKGLSARTALHAHRILSQSLSHAVKWGLLVRNVCDAVDSPRPGRKEMNVLDAHDIQRLLEGIADSPYRHVFFIAVYTGLRRGEILGLRWSDIDLKMNNLSVNRTVSRVKGKGIIISDPKTPFSRRCVALPFEANKLLSSLKSKQTEQAESLGIGWIESAYVFPDSDGMPLSPDTASHAFARTVKRLGLPQVRFHDLRHTHATIMLKQGVHPKIVSERLGHASVNITLDIYSHVLPNMQESAVIAFEQALKDVSSKSSIETL